MKYLICILAILLINLADSRLGCAKPPATGGLLTVRVTECLNCRIPCEIIIVDEDNKVERIELAKQKLDDYTPNQKIITSTLNKIKANGYKFLSASQSGIELVYTFTYIFEKQ